MSVNVGTTLTSLKELFNQAKEIYYRSSEITSEELTDGALSVDMELPVLEDGLNFDTGDADVTEIKLTTGAIWVSNASKGDSDITMQVASIAGAVNSLFLNEKTGNVSNSSLIDGVSLNGMGYSLAPKKVTGALVFFGEDRSAVVVLPSVEMYASLVVSDGDNPAYFNVTVTPVENSEGADIFIMTQSAGN